MTRYDAHNTLQIIENKLNYCSVHYYYYTTLRFPLFAGHDGGWCHEYTADKYLGAGQPHH